MKKLLLSFALATAVVAVNAQDMTSKRGVPILPEADEWALGIDATPFLEYAGNLFTDTQNDGPSFDFTRNNTLWFKKVRDEGFHYRGLLRIGFGSNTTQNNVRLDPDTMTIPVYVNDERKTSSMNITIGAGFEKRRGKGRLQGYYGPELSVSFGSSSTEFTYGNTFSADNETPTITTNFDIGNDPGTASGSRTTEINDGSTFGIGLRGFVGLEYFFAPKLSIGGEFGWGLMLSSTGEGETITETWDPFNDRLIVRTNPNPGKESSFGIDTDNMGGAIRLVGYF